MGSAKHTIRLTKCQHSSTSLLSLRHRPPRSRFLKFYPLQKPCNTSRCPTSWSPHVPDLSRRHQKIWYILFLSRYLVTRILTAFSCQTHGKLIQFHIPLHLRTGSKARRGEERMEDWSGEGEEVLLNISWHGYNKRRCASNESRDSKEIFDGMRFPGESFPEIPLFIFK